MKKFYFIFLFFLLTSPIYATIAITDDGRIAILNNDFSWKYKDAQNIPTVPIPIDEASLYKICIREKRTELFEQYLNYYEGDDLRNTISLLYFYSEDFPSSYYLSDSDYDKYVDTLKKGILYTEKYGKIFQIKYSNGVSMYSNLYFFWKLANLFESNKDYIAALNLFQKLEKYFTETKEQFVFSFTDNTLDVIQGKIYLVNLLSGS